MVSSNGLLGAHAFAFVAHFAQFLILLYLVANNEGQSWPLILRGFDENRARYTYPLANLVPVFPALSSVNHLAAVVGRSWYESAVLESKSNWLRWAEYSLSAGDMLWIIASLSGVLELRSLISLLLANVILQYIGYLIERAKESNAGSFILFSLLGIGFGVHVYIWSQILISFYNSLESSGEVPGFVYSIIIAMFVFFTAFGVLSALWALGVVEDFSNVELGYVILSLTSKSFLTWMVYFGVLREPFPFQETPTATE